jgi:hypothetical protein
MSVGVGGNYQSPEAILAFTALQQDRMYGDLKDAMALATTRGEMTSDLADIKSHLEFANRNHDFAQVDAELQAFVEKYGEVREFAEIIDTVSAIADNVHGRWTEVVQLNAEAQSNYASMHGRWVAEGCLGPEPQPPGPPKLGEYKPETIKNWLDSMTDKIDASGTNDQLTMISIQQLNTSINQSSETASTIMDSRSDTLSSIINNIA